MVLEKDGEDRLGPLCRKGRNITWRQVGEENPTYKKKKNKEGWKAKWMDYVLLRNCLLKHFTEGKI